MALELIHSLVNLQDENAQRLWLEQLRDKLTVEDWHYVGDATDPIAPSFDNSWANVAGSSPAAFYKWAGVVHLRGNVDSGATGTTAFVLPEGYRPPYNSFQILYNNNGGPGPGGASVYAAINASTGAVALSYGAGTDMWLDGLSFRVDS